MSYNNQRNYNIRLSTRFNRPGIFSPASMNHQNHQNYQIYDLPVPPGPPPPPVPLSVPLPARSPIPLSVPLPPTPAPPSSRISIKEAHHGHEHIMLPPGEPENQSSTSSSGPRQPYFKTKLAGVKKITNKERRRRQNALLRRLTTPKNALMCINEMLPNEQIANQFKVEMAPPDNSYYNTGAHNFCAELALDGQTYQGYGESKLTARNAAAEQAIRDIVLKKMERYTESLAANASASASALDDENSLEAEGEEAEAEAEALPMIQLLSFALHKLFAEWEGAGHHVPQLRPMKADRAQVPADDDLPWKTAMEDEITRPPPSVPSFGSRAPKERKIPPDNASSMHPAMLLTLVRPTATYREISAEGDKPQNMRFTVCVEVEGRSFIGKATSKKEARKNAARAACKSLLGITFDDEK